MRYNTRSIGINPVPVMIFSIRRCLFTIDTNPIRWVSRAVFECHCDEFLRSETLLVQGDRWATVGFRIGFLRLRQRTPCLESYHSIDGQPVVGLEFHHLSVGQVSE